MCVKNVWNEYMRRREHQPSNLKPGFKPWHCRPLSGMTGRHGCQLKLKIKTCKSLKSGLGYWFLPFLVMCRRIWVKLHDLSVIQEGTVVEFENSGFESLFCHLSRGLRQFTQILDFLTCNIEKIIVPVAINVLHRFRSLTCAKNLE